MKHWLRYRERDSKGERFERREKRWRNGEIENNRDGECMKKRCSSGSISFSWRLSNIVECAQKLHNLSKLETQEAKIANRKNQLSL